jgi:Tfp pilus assembly protein PilN
VSQVNLLPPEILQRQRTKRISLAVIAAGVALVLVSVFFYLLQVGDLSSVRRRIDDVQAANTALEGQIGGLQEFAELQLRAQAKGAILTAVYANEVSFAGLLQDMSQAIPADAYLSSLSISITGIVTDTGEAAPTGLVGGMTFGGQGLGTDAAAALITSFDQVDGWVNTFVNGIARQEGLDVVDFTGSVDLTGDVLTKRGQRGAEATPEAA